MKKYMTLEFENINVKIGGPGTSKTTDTVEYLKNTNGKKLILTPERKRYEEVKDAEVAVLQDSLVYRPATLYEVLDSSQYMPSVVVIDEATYLFNESTHFNAMLKVARIYPNMKFIIITQQFENIKIYSGPGA